MSLFRRDDEDPALFAALVEQAGMANHLWVLADRLRKPSPDVLDLAKGLELAAAYFEPTAGKVAPITAQALPLADEQTPELGPGKPQDPSLDGWVVERSSVAKSGGTTPVPASKSDSPRDIDVSHRS